MKKDSKTPDFKNATGKIDYTLMNDYIFHRVMQDNKKALKGLTCSLLHLNPEDILSIIVMNPIEQGKSIDAKTCILDLKIMLNNEIIINLELQVENQTFWNDRSVTYFARIIDTPGKGDDYADIKPVYHIGILNFTPFPDYPEFYAANKLINVKKHYVYNDKFSLNVLDLNQIELATDEDKLWKLDEWARLFKAKTWEELHMLAHQNDILEEACESIFELNQDEVARLWAEAREEGLRIIRTREHLYKQYEKKLAEIDNVIAEKNNALAEKDNALAEKDNALAEKDNALAEKDNALAEKDNALAEKDNALAEKDNALAEKDAQIALLMEQLQQKSNA